MLKYRAKKLAGIIFRLPFIVNLRFAKRYGFTKLILLAAPSRREDICYKTFGSCFSTHRYNASITFHGTRAVLSDKIYRGARVVGGCGRDIPVNTLDMLCEEHRNDVYLPSLLYTTVTLSRVSRARRSRSGRSVCRGMDTRARGSKTKRTYAESRRFLIVHKGRVDCPDNGGTDTKLVYTWIIHR